MSLPAEKVAKARETLNWAIDKKCVTIHFIQRLTGLLNFLNRAIVPGRAFTRGMYEKLKLKDKTGSKLKQHHHVSLGSDFIKDCLVWKQFLGNIDNDKGLCRPFIDIMNSQDADVLQFYTDSSLNKNLGCGGLFGTSWFVYKWDPDFIERYKPSIGYLELFALAAGVLIWGSKKEMVNTRVIIFCDNNSAKANVNTYASGCKQSPKLLRTIAMNCLKFNRRIYVQYVSSSSNVLADSLSRLNFKRFRRNAPKGMNKNPEQMPQDLVPMEKIWLS